MANLIKAAMDPARQKRIAEMVKRLKRKHDRAHIPGGQNVEAYMNENLLGKVFQIRTEQGVVMQELRVVGICWPYAILEDTILKQQRKVRFEYERERNALKFFPSD